MQPGATPPSRNASPGSHRTSGPRRPRRRVPCSCVAPAGSGKTTTLVARVAWLVDGGADPDRSCVVAFNKRAAEELTERLDAALEPLGVAPGSVRVRTFHALGREILRDAGVSVEPLVDRDDAAAGALPGDRAGGPGAARPRVLAAQAGPAGHRG